MSYLNFEEAVEQRTTSWERADPAAAMIEQRSETTYAVLLPDGEESHTVTYGKERGAFVGHCDCKAQQFHDLPCAHLCTLRKAEFSMSEFGDAAGRDVHGRPVEATSTGPGHEPEPELVTDGGESPATWFAGKDGQPFGRPEQRR